ncbi:hypothetical protein V1638_14945 [Pseudarthrobacter sp. J64]|uniref:hypothetical protein n=1 Tax=Pseudarthrobacter sp. J64 TaxID=3116485 RepID=UPI002E801362|nr:hypothetical protein [Pseudarthrobacter sp. J64]MEE2570681.1 hypothetical protein [Pseudarthrobacter sp. J64]
MAINYLDPSEIARLVRTKGVLTVDPSLPAATGAGTPPEGWQLQVSVKPGSEDGKTSEPALDLEVDSPAWRDAADAVRTTVKWIVAAFAVVGGLMFAKGFITTPELSWSDDWLQLIIAGALGVIGILGVGLLLYTAVRMLRPAVYDIHDLPPAFIELVNNPQNHYLPARIANLEQFTKELKTARRSVISATQNYELARKHLADSEHENATDPDAVKKAQQDADAAKKLLDAVVRSFNTLKKVRANLLNKAEYWQHSTAFDHRGRALFGAALMAGLGGIGYQLALAAPADPAKDDAPPAAAPTIGELIRSDSDAGLELWEQLGLSNCQADAAVARIPVVVASGAGSAQDPFVVSTLPIALCPGQTFTVIDPVARVSIPEKREIIYQPAPSVTTSAPATSR